jgi:choline/carnitine/betaine transport
VIPQVNRRAETTSRSSTDWVLFGIVGAFTLAFVIWGLVAPDQLADVSQELLRRTIAYGGWIFVIEVNVFIIVALWLALSRYGGITLGPDNVAPEFKTSSWLAMLFSVGMGIGLMFYGVAEPVAHFSKPPPVVSAVPYSDEAVDKAMAVTLLHWGIHPWAVYAIVGLAIAYSTYRCGRSQLISATFAPLLGRRAQGPLGKAIDIAAVFATLFGSAASFGLGALQISSGLRSAGLVDSAGSIVLLGIVGVLTAAFVASAVSGIARCIQWLATFNMLLAAALAAIVFIAGPTIFILNVIPRAVGSYFSELAVLATETGLAEGDPLTVWLSGWTIFYWAWWISWTPFVGMFLARISRGRTIRQFVAGVILVPSVVSLLWFSIFGGAGIDAQRQGTGLAGESSEGQLFRLIDTLPLAGVLSVVALVLIALFFVSGADAASVVMGTLSQRGRTRPSRKLVAAWGLMVGCIAAIMLATGDSDGGALVSIQTITIIMAGPFGLLIVALCFSLVRDLRSDPFLSGSRSARTKGCADGLTTVSAQNHDADTRVDGQQSRHS